MKFWNNLPFQDDLPSNGSEQGSSSFSPVSRNDECLLSRGHRRRYIVSFGILHDARESAAWWPRGWAVWVTWFNIVQLFLPEKSLVYFHKLQDVIREERQRNVRTEQARSPRWKHWVPWTRRSNIFFDLEGKVKDKVCIRAKWPIRPELIRVSKSKTLLCLWPVVLRKFALFSLFKNIPF